jgi:ketosteroid isomerase-like protein
MSEESTTPDLVELARRSFEAADRRDFGALMSFYAPDAVWDTSPMGLGVYENPTAIRGFFEDWMGAYEEYGMALEEVLDLGDGVAFAVAIQKGRPAGSSGEVRLRYASVSIWENSLIVRVTNYTDIDEARAVAERLAEERG